MEMEQLMGFVKHDRAMGWYAKRFVPCPFKRPTARPPAFLSVAYINGTGVTVVELPGRRLHGLYPRGS